MKSVISYGSRYGSARRYAQELSKQTDIPAVSYQEAPPLSKLETIMYIGALYAGGVLGLTKTLRRQSFGEQQRLVIVTVDWPTRYTAKQGEYPKRPAKADSRPAIWQSSGFPSAGAIDYQALSLGHRTMMPPLYRSLQKKSAEEWNEEDRTLMKPTASGGFCRFRFLRPIVNEIQGDTE